MEYIDKQFKASEDFRREAVHKGLAYDWPNKMPNRHFSFYINMTGDLYTPQDPMAIISLVLLGQKYAINGHGDHRIILGLYGNARELDAGSDRVYWDYQMNIQHPILLADWILQNANPKTIEEKWDFYQFLKYVYREIYRKPVPIVERLFWWI